MLTVLFYSFILISSTFFIYLSERISGSSEKFIFVFLAFLLVFIPSAIRYDIGTDFLSYINMYENLEDYSWIEPGFYYINKILREIEAHPQWLIINLSFIFTLVCFKGYPKRNAWIIHFFIVCFLYLSSFNLIRQSIAIVICLWALRLFLNNNILYFFIVSLFAIAFHNSSVLFIIVALLSVLPIKDSFKIYFLPVLFVFSLYIFIFKSNEFFVFLESLLIFLSLDKVANYFSDTKHFVATELGTGLSVLSKLFFSFFFIMNTKYIIALNKRNWIVVLLVYMYAISLILSAQIVIFSRAVYILTVGLPYAVYFLLSIEKNKKMNRVVVLIFSLVVFMSFVKDSFSVPSDYGDPNLNPYQTFFYNSK